MLNRRHIRVKVLQALYGYIQSGLNNVPAAEKTMVQSSEEIYRLYLFQLSLLLEFRHFAFLDKQDAKNKKIPSPEDLKDSNPFLDNLLLKSLADNPSFLQRLSHHKVSWSAYQDEIHKVWRKVKKTDFFLEYMATPQPTEEQDLQVLMSIFTEVVFQEEVLESIYETLNIHWIDDLYVVNHSLIKTLKTLGEKKKLKLEKLYKDENDDKAFMVDLFRKVILYNDEFQELIQEKAKNWELERIAVMDLLLMKMAMTELVTFSSIPIKVTLNEYIELSKHFSTPKSNTFINGILDKVMADFKASGKMQKTGRGLLDA
jgi:N utilization substance protein B